MRHLPLLVVAMLSSLAASAIEPDLGPNVLLIDTARTDAQERIHAIFKEQERAQFGTGRHAILFKPGRYDLDVPVGFYTHVAGLGVYHVFKRAPVVADNAIETPAGPGIRMHHMLTIRLGGGRPGSGIRNVINGRGGEVISAQKATVD